MVRGIFVFAACLCCTVLQAQIGNSTISMKQIGMAAPGTGEKLGNSSLPVCLPDNSGCSAPYIFTGNGNWSVEANWLGGIKPPPVLPAGKTIIISPIVGGECILNVVQTIAAGALLQVTNDRRFVVMKNLVYQQ